MLRTVLVAAALLALPGCKALGFLGFGGSEDSVVVQYAADAETNLKLGDEHLESRAYPEAQKYFEYVRTKFPYLEASKTAELRLGDVEFEREKYSEARDRYNNFIKLHPTHARVDYAAFRAALTHFKDIPSDFFLFPAASEKDQADVRAAMNSLGDFLKTYPKSQHKDEAEKVYTQVRKRLADHEWYVADFYRSRDRWPAVVGRLSVLERDYADVGYDEKVYFGLYEAYTRLKEDDKAKEALRALVQRKPDTDGAKRAQKILGPQG
jgi:outer membrane protein assembly factor BamD